MASLFPFRTLALCVALGALIGCRDYASLNPAPTPAPPEPPPLQYRIKRIVSGNCNGSGVQTAAFTYTKDLFVDQTTYPDDVRERGVPNCRYNYQADGRLQAIAIDGREAIDRPTGLTSYTYTPTSINEQFEARYPDGRQEFTGRNTYTLSGGLIVGHKEQYFDTGYPVTNQWTYEYTKGNVSRVLCKGQYGQTKLDISYAYDDKPNPFYRPATYNWVGAPSAGIYYLSFSRNNILKAIVRSPYNPNTVTVRTFQYTYNEQGLPLTQTRDDDGCQVARYEYETY